MARFLRLICLLVWSAIVVGCPERSAIWVREGATARRLEFGIGRYRDDQRGFPTSYLRVYSCEGPAAGKGAAWIINSDTAQTHTVNWVIYGELPPGWTLVEGPAKLKPGCYRAAISGTGLTEFQVDPDGNITEVKPE